MKQNSLHKIGSSLLLSSFLLFSGCGDSNTSTIPDTPQVARVQSQVVANISNVESDSNISVPVVVFKADAGVDQVVIYHSEFTFDGSKSTGDIVSYEWVFGEHVLNADDTANSTYSRLATQPAGDYSVILKITDVDGDITTDEVIIKVIDQMPTEVSVDQFKLLMQAGVTYIDIRSEMEQAVTAVIAGSEKIVYEDFDITPWLKDGSSFLNLISDKNREFVLICTGGSRAKSAANELMDAGYTNVHWLSGGIRAWNASK